MDEAYQKAARQMDEAYRKFVHELAVAVERLGTAYYGEICEAAEKLREMFSDPEDVPDEMPADFASLEELANELDKSLSRDGRKKWNRASTVRIPEFLFDRRGKIHRCRNNC